MRMGKLVLNLHGPLLKSLKLNWEKGAVHGKRRKYTTEPQEQVPKHTADFLGHNQNSVQHGMDFKVACIF